MIRHEIRPAARLRLPHRRVEDDRDAVLPQLSPASGDDLLDRQRLPRVCGATSRRDGPSIRAAPSSTVSTRTWPIVYGEEAYGFAKTGQTILNVPDGKILKLYVDDEPLYLPTANLLEFERTLDMRRARWTGGCCGRRRRASKCSSSLDASFRSSTVTWRRSRTRSRCSTPRLRCAISSQLASTADERSAPRHRSAQGGRLQGTAPGSAPAAR